MQIAFQIGGTSCTLVAAIIILLRLCKNPASKIPIIAMCFQLAASTNWALFAVGARLWMLLVCSCINVILYIISTGILIRNKKHTVTSVGLSNPTQPQV